MMKFLELFSSAIILWVTNYYIAKNCFGFGRCKNKIKLIILTIICSLLLIAVNTLEYGAINYILRFILSYFLICLYYKFIFETANSEILISSFIRYLLMFGSEIILVIILSPIIEIIGEESLAFLEHTLLINVLNSIISYLIAKIGQKAFSNLIKNTEFKGRENIFIILLLIVTIALLFFRIPISEWRLNFDLIFTMIVLLSFCIVGFLIIKQKSDIQRTTAMYQQLAEYSDITNNVLEEYRVVTHEHKNQLLIIRGMLENRDKDLNDYVDNLLEKREGIKYKWIGQLNHLPLSGLKGLINYKILEMESLKLNKVITISNEVSKIKLEKLTIKQKDDLYSMIGVYLDNAIQAAKDSENKEISLEIYKEKKEIVIILANTYSGKIEIEKLDNYGYTTKGKKHGVGLHIVKNILQNETIFNSNRYILDNYFVQELRVNIGDISQKKKH